MNWPRLHTKNIIALITVAGIIYFMNLLLTRGFPPKNESAIMLVLGYLLRSAVDPVYRFFFPSKKDSEPTKPSN